MSWDEHGVWIGHVEQENGQWLIGDQLPEGHPGHIDPKDPRGLMVKYWTACSNDASRKYLGVGYTPPLPAHGERIEGVQVLWGWLCCEYGACILELGRGSGKVISNDRIDLRPSERRRWFLGNSTFAWGVTICRQAEVLPEVFGAGAGYEYLVLDTAQTKPDKWPGLLRAPAHLANWSCQLMMLFRGFMCRRVAGKVIHRLLAFSKNYVYTQPGTEGDWLPLVGKSKTRTIVAVVYY